MNRFPSLRSTVAIHAVLVVSLFTPTTGHTQVRILPGHTHDVLAVAFSPDGKYLASGSGDRTIRLWDVQTGNLLKTFSGHTDGVRSVTFSPDGNYLASGSWDKTVRLWSLQHGSLLKTFIGHTQQVFSVAFSPDGQEILSASQDNSVRLWNIQLGKQTRMFEHQGRVFSVAFSKDGTSMATGSDDKLVRLWSIDSGELIGTLSGHDNSVISVAFCPDGLHLASGSGDHSIRMWDIGSQTFVRKFSGHTNLVSSIAFSADGNYLASAGFDNSVRLWNVEQGTLVKTFTGHQSPVLSIAFSPDGLYIASGGEDKTIRLWSIDGITSEKSDPKSPPLLIIDQHSVSFHDTNGNDRLDAGELATVELVLMNRGKGAARGLKVISRLTGSRQDIAVTSPAISPLQSGGTETVTTILKAGLNTQTGKAVLSLRVAEPNGLDSEPVELEFNTLSFQPPSVIAADGIFSSESGGKLKNNYPANLEVLVQNTGSGSADEITATVVLPENVLSLDPDYLPIARLNPGESIRLKTSFIVTARYTSQDVPIRILFKERYGKYGSEKTFMAHLDQPLATARISVQGESFKAVPIVLASLHSEVDKNIPLRDVPHPNRFALVIGNEDYQRFQTGLQIEQNVVFARNDAIVFKEYLVKTLGFPEKQVFLLTDATRGQMGRELERLVQLAKITPNAELVFYYAGHGLPDENTHRGYLIPVDVTASSLQEGILLSDLYKKLASSKASRVTVFLDACFSGGGRGENGLLASRTVKVKPKGDLVEGNVIVFTAASGEEVSLPLTRESHGLFTYCVLSKLQETNGNITMSELRAYLDGEVPRLSLLENSQQQTPQVLVAPDLGEKWLDWKWQ